LSGLRSPSPSSRVALLVLAALVAVACESTSSADGEVESFPNLRPRFPVDRPLGFIANQDSDTVSVIDLGEPGAGGMGGMGGLGGAAAPFTVLAEVPIGRDPVDFDGPRSLVFDSAREVFYVALTYSQSVTSPHVQSARRSGYLQVLARDDLRPLSEIRLQPAAFAVALSPDGGEIVTTHYDKLLPILVDGDPSLSRAPLAFSDPDDIEQAPSQVALCVAPADVAYQKDGAILVACVGDDSVVRLDGTTREVTAELDIDPAAPQKPVWLEVDARSGRIAVSYEVTRHIGVLESGAGLSLEHLVQLEGVPQRPFWLSEERLAVPTMDPDALVVVDLETDSIENVVAFEPSDCHSPGSLTEVSGGRLFLVCQQNHFVPGTLLELDRSDFDVLGRALLGLFPDRMVVDEP
jgi:hypothetical protein